MSLYVVIGEIMADLWSCRRVGPSANIESSPNVVKRPLLPWHQKAPLATLLNPWVCSPYQLFSILYKISCKLDHNYVDLFQL